MKIEKSKDAKLRIQQRLDGEAEAAKKKKKKKGKKSKKAKLAASGSKAKIYPEGELDMDELTTPLTSPKANHDRKVGEDEDEDDFMDMLNEVDGFEVDKDDML